jgi:MoaA/NifB/PqqE/SkfB family radical SAM enzyme
MNKPELQYEMYLHWTLLRECNFSCAYCCSSGTTKKRLLPPKINIPAVIERLNRFDRTMLITFSGGEPFLIPNFSEFVAAVTQRHYVRIDTNFSLKKPLERFLKIVNPDKVLEITFSIHTLEREKRRIPIDSLPNMVTRFRKKGFRMVGNYVVYPPLLSRLEQDISFFACQGITVLPTLFHGKYDGTTYPFHKGVLAYNKHDLQLITNLNPRATILLRNTKNTLCHAGSTAFAIDPDYIVTPCVMIKKKIGQFFGYWQKIEGVIRCPVKYCVCAFNDEFPASSINSHQAHLVKKGISERGLLSKVESRKATFSCWDLLVDIARKTKANRWPLSKRLYRRLS